MDGYLQSVVKVFQRVKVCLEVRKEPHLVAELGEALLCRLSRRKRGYDVVVTIAMADAFVRCGACRKLGWVALLARGTHRAWPA